MNEESRPVRDPARPERPTRLLDPLPATASVGWGWWLCTFLEGGALAAAWAVGAVSLVAVCTLSLAATAGLACTPPGERVMRTLGLLAWAGRTCLLAVVPVAALGIVLASGLPGLLLWLSGLLAGWFLLVRPQPVHGGRRGREASPPPTASTAQQHVVTVRPRAGTP